MENKPKTVKVKYLRSDEYRVLPVAGAVVSGTGQGMVICHIYTDLGTPPESSEITFKSDGTIPEEKLNLASEVNRELLVGLLMTPQVALNLSRILGPIADLTNQAIQAAQAAQKAN